ncbi:MAG: hypothetical protein GY769_18610 [bacterium]|nr:hypothetical protein [bacterium]
MQLDCDKTLDLGIRACSDGNWEEGLRHLRLLKHEEGACGRQPGVFYSHLGLAMARCEGRMHEGHEWCTHAVTIQPAEPTNYLNLAQTYLLLKNRRGALHALVEGLAVDAAHPGLLKLRRALGFRYRLPIWCLARVHELKLSIRRHRARSEARRHAARRRPRLGEDSTGIFRPAD